VLIISKINNFLRVFELNDKILYFYTSSKYRLLHRKILRNTLIIIAAAVIILIIGLTVYLSLAANQLKGMLEEEFSYQLELNCEIRGDIKVRVLPGIRLMLHDVYFDNGQEDILSGEQVIIKIPFSFLFNDKIEIEQLELVRPKLHVWYDKGGTSSWSLIGTDISEYQTDSIEFEYSIDLQKVSVEEGQIHVTDKVHGDTIILENIHILSDTLQFTGSNLGYSLRW